LRTYEVAGVTVVAKKEEQSSVPDRVGLESAMMALRQLSRLQSLGRRSTKGLAAARPASEKRSWSLMVKECGDGVKNDLKKMLR
jgi:hypothetical protein